MQAVLDFAFSFAPLLTLSSLNQQWISALRNVKGLGPVHAAQMRCQHFDFKISKYRHHFRFCDKTPTELVSHQLVPVLVQIQNCPEISFIVKHYWKTPLPTKATRYSTRINCNRTPRLLTFKYVQNTNLRVLPLWNPGIPCLVYVRWENRTMVQTETSKSGFQTSYSDRYLIQIVGSGFVWI